MTVTLSVLKTENEIKESRDTLIKQGCSSLEGPIHKLKRQLLKKLGFNMKIPVGDRLKSWDVLKTLELLKKNITPNEPILDIGCFASEILHCASKAGFSNLHGIDLNPLLNKMNNLGHIKFQNSNFFNTNFPNESFKAITSISVIEHGYAPQKLLKEVSRLLMHDGVFIASFDYWRTKTDTTGIKIFDMDWMIFSEDDVKEFISIAKSVNLTPLGELNFDTQDKVINWGGKEYTFGWIVLQKQNNQLMKKH